MDNRKTNNVYLFIVHLLGFRSLVYWFSWAARNWICSCLKKVELFSKLCQCFPKGQESCLPIFVRNLQVLKTWNSFLHMLSMKRAKVNKSHIETYVCQQLSNLARGRHSGLWHACSKYSIQTELPSQTVQGSFKAAKHSYCRAHGLESRSLNGLSFSTELWFAA